MMLSATSSHFPPATWDDDPVAWGSVEQVFVAFSVVLRYGFENRIPGRVGPRLPQKFLHELEVCGVFARVETPHAFLLDTLARHRRRSLNSCSNMISGILCRASRTCLPPSSST